MVRDCTAMKSSYKAGKKKRRVITKKEGTKIVIDPSIPLLR